MTTVIHMQFTMPAMTTNEEFGRWLSERMKERRLEPVDVETRSGGEISSSLVGLLMRGGKGTGEKSLRALARGLRMPQAEVFYAAGLLTERPDDPVFSHPILADLWKVVQDMTEDQIEKLVAFAKFQANAEEMNEQKSKVGGARKSRR